MSSSTELLYHQQTSSSGFVVSEIPNPRDARSINNGAWYLVCQLALSPVLLGDL